MDVWPMRGRSNRQGSAYGRLFLSANVCFFVLRRNGPDYVPDS
jgi:hypothetical protein